MALVEALLIYSPKSLGDNESQIIIGKTSDSNVIKQLSEAIVTDSMKEVEMWKNIDPAIAAMCKADVKKLQSIISMFLQEEKSNNSLIKFRKETN